MFPPEPLMHSSKRTYLIIAIGVIIVKTAKPVATGRAETEVEVLPFEAAA